MKINNIFILFASFLIIVSCGYFNSENEPDRNFEKLRKLYLYDSEPNTIKDLKKINNFYFFMYDENPAIRAFFLQIAAEKFVSEKSIKRNEITKTVDLRNIERLKYSKTYRKYAKKLLKDISIILRYRNPAFNNRSEHQLTECAIYAAGLIGHWELAPEIYENMIDIISGKDELLTKMALDAISVNGMEADEVKTALNYLEKYRPEMQPEIQICLELIQ